MNNGKRSEIKTKRKMCDDAKSNNHIRFRLNKKQESILGKQCKPVQVHSFSWIVLWAILRKFTCWGDPQSLRTSSADDGYEQSCWQYPERISALNCCVTMVTVVTMKRRANQGLFVSSPSSQPSHLEKYNLSLWENLQIWKPGLHWKHTNGGHSQHQRCSSMGFGAAAPTSSLWLWIATSIACQVMQKRCVQTEHIVFVVLFRYLVRLSGKGNS